MNVPEDDMNDALETASQLQQSGLRLSRLLTASLDTKNASLSKLRVLGCLHQGGAKTLTELAAHLRVRPQSLTRVTAELEEGGLITRRRSGEDRRRVLLEIAERGAGVLAQSVRAERIKLAESMVRLLTPVEREVLKMAAELMGRLAAAAEPPPSARPKGGQPEKNQITGSQPEKDQITGGQPEKNQITGGQPEKNQITGGKPRGRGKP